jgi:hypothetical protein
MKIVIEATGEYQHPGKEILDGIAANLRAVMEAYGVKDIGVFVGFAPKEPEGTPGAACRCGGTGRLYDEETGKSRPCPLCECPPGDTTRNSATIAELERLGKWVRAMEYERDDAPDEIARAIENRVRELRKGVKATAPEAQG